MTPSTNELYTKFCFGNLAEPTSMTRRRRDLLKLCKCVLKTCLFQQIKELTLNRRFCFTKRPFAFYSQRRNRVSPVTTDENGAPANKNRRRVAADPMAGR